MLVHYVAILGITILRDRLIGSGAGLPVQRQYRHLGVNH